MNTLLRLAGLMCLSLCAHGATPLRLVVNPWPASRLDAEVATVVLKQELGRETVLAEADERAQWELLARDEADASLELWPSGHREAWARHVVEARDVASGGELGVVGQIGWFTTKAVVAANPELATWEGYRAGGKAGVFARDGGRGVLLAGDPSWTQFDAEIVRNLKLELDVVSLGSEAALVAEVRRAAREGEAVLTYLYTPHALFQEMDLVMVRLPPHDAEMWKKAGEGAAACAYPREPLQKIFSTSLGRRDPVAAAFLRALRLDNAAQVEMLASLELGYTPREAAETWVMAHPNVWAPWVEKARKSAR